MAKSDRGLGRGLDSLFGGSGDSTGLRNTEDKHVLPIDKIFPNSNQPRKNFSEAALDELAESIRNEGVLQPLLVRPLPDGNYEIVAGERRWRAGKKVNLRQIPVIIKEFTDEQALAIALIENLQREDLNPMEEALGYKELRDKFNLNQNEIAVRVGKNRSTVANTLRLLQLPLAFQESLISGQITQGHARPLLAVDDEKALLVFHYAILTYEPNVREVELWVTNWKNSGLLPGNENITKDPRTPRGKREIHPSFPALETQLAERLGLKTSLRGTFEGGSLRLTFSSREEFSQLLKGMGLVMKEQAGGQHDTGSNDGAMQI